MDKKSLSTGVWTCTERFPKFSRFEMADYIGEMNQSPTLRSRVCMHKSPQDRMQEMFIAFSGKTYVRPSFHYKDESFHLIDGLGKYVFFDSKGQWTHDVRLGTYRSELPFYCRIPTEQAHSLVLYTPHAMAHEVVAGPFSREFTVFPEWSSDLQTEKEKDQFRHRYTLHPVAPIQGCQWERMTDEMCRAKPGIIALKRSDMDYLKSEVLKVPRKRIRLCIHPNDQAELHEMFVVYTDCTYVRPNKHLGKDESLHILEGEADFIFFDDTGKVIEVVRLGPQGSDKNFYVRVPQGVFHTLIMRSSHIVIHEATPGPFNRDDTLWAPWAPLDFEKEKVNEFMQKLETQIGIL